ncbi:phage portal protein [Bradyrhizobium elkanii]|uniref:phage portal protein n=1 Tax=Bradyrhizobium elkanii TaxID=29448 RepID=UPI003517655A
MLDADETRSAFSSTDADAWPEIWTGRSVSGIGIGQISALNSSAVMAATTMLAEDVAKLPWAPMRTNDDGSKSEAKDHFLYDLLQEPNEWQNGLEMREMMQVGLILRGNAYALIKRNGRGRPVALYPWNADRMQPWIGADGAIFYRPTGFDQHEIAILDQFPQLIPAEDVLHIRGFSLNGLMGASRISLAREAIALGLAQEQQAARWMGNGAKPSGMLTTDQKLTPDAAKRLEADFKQNVSGLQNSGKIIVGEQGLKFLPFSMTAADIEFISSRQFQLQEVARIFRIPPHMIGELSRSTNNNIAQQAQEYVNYTLTGYTNRWRAKLSSTFGLRAENISVEFDYRDLTQADMTTRMNYWRTAVMSMIAKPDEARVDFGWKPEGGEAGKLHFPQNMAAAGSQSTGTGADGSGRPEGS